MAPQHSFPRRRETFLALSFAVGLACLIALYFLVIGGRYFLAGLAVLGGMILFAGLQYLFWGRSMSYRSPNSPRTTHFPR